MSNSHTSTTETREDAVAKCVDSLRLDLNNRVTAFEKRRDDFIAKATSDPSYAIEWAESLISAQREEEIAATLIHESANGTPIEFVATVRGIVKSLQRESRRQHTAGDMLTAAVRMAKWTATVEMLDRLESWLDYADRVITEVSR